MRRLRPIAICLLLIGLIAWVGSTASEKRLHAQDAEPIDWNEWDVIPGRLIVEFTPERSERIKRNRGNEDLPLLKLVPLEQTVEEMVTSTEGAQSFVSLLPNTFIGTFQVSDLESVIATLANDPEVVYFEPDRVRISDTTWGTPTPNDLFLTDQWGMRRINAAAGWARQSTQRSPIRVAVMEGRFYNAHEDLTGQAIGTTNNDGSITDHATHVAGIIAGTGNNTIGVAGVANATLVSLSLPSSSTGFALSVVWAVNNDVRVVNMSFKWCGDGGCDECSYSSHSITEQQAITNALGRIVFVAAAGNDACSVDGGGRAPKPAAYDGVIGVSALNAWDTLAGFSNFGAYVDLTAPGVGIRSTLPLRTTSGLASTYEFMSGTSMAAPHVAGAAGAILAIDPTFDSRSVSRLLLLTASDLGIGGRDDSFGLGVVRMDRAVSSLADVYLDSTQCSNNGTLSAPYCNIGQAINAVPDNGRLGIVRGNSFPVGSTITLSKPMTIVTVGGTVTIGR